MEIIDEILYHSDIGARYFHWAHTKKTMSVKIEENHGKTRALGTKESGTVGNPTSSWGETHGGGPRWRRFDEAEMFNRCWPASGWSRTPQPGCWTTTTTMMMTMEDENQDEDDEDEDVGFRLRGKGRDKEKQEWGKDRGA